MGTDGIDDVDRDLAEVGGMENDVDGIAGEGDDGRPMLRAGVFCVKRSVSFLSRGLRGKVGR